MILKTGSYTGTGVAQEITTGINADLIILKVMTAVGTAADCVAKTSTMAADAVKALDGNATGLETGVITSITATGFTVDTDNRANNSGLVYNWLAVEDNGAGDFAVGTYNGDGTNGRTITATGITGTPGWVGILTAYTVGGFWRSNVHTGDASGWFDSTAAHTTDGIEAFGSGTFQVGQRDQVNRGTGTPAYHWFAFVETALKFQVVLWTGNGLDSQSVTGAGFTPTFSLHQRIVGGGNSMIVRGPAHVGDLASFISNAQDVANLIQAFEADGHQVGTHANVNAATSYAALFFQGEPDAPAASNGSLLLLGVGT